MLYILSPILVWRKQSYAVICSELMEGGFPINRGYNAISKEYLNMYNAEIIDPAKVPHAGLMNTTSVAGMLIINKCMIIGISEEVNAQ